MEQPLGTIFNKLKLNYLVSIIMPIILVGVLTGLYLYLKYQTTHPSTDDAFIKSHIVTIAPLVNGRIKQVYVKNYQAVNKGQLLFAIEDLQYDLLVKQAEYQLQLAQLKIRSGKAGINAIRAELEQARIKHGVIAKNAHRTKVLVDHKEAPYTKEEEINANLAASEQGIIALENRLKQNMLLVGQDDNQHDQDNPSLKVAQNALALAQYNLNNTKIYATSAGVINNLRVHAGDLVAVGSPLAALINTDNWKVIANFKEKHLRHININQPALITLSMYPEITFHGVVSNISQTSGSTFSLLPPQNATGNWVKMEQRFPVEIKITDADQKHPFRIGASANVKINPQS